LKPTAHKIEIADQQNQDLDPEPLIKSVEAILDDHDVAASEISLALVDDPTIRELNRQYLDHDYETDVISFVLDWNEQDRSLVGQLIVSTDTAQNKGAEFGLSMFEELVLYVIHGTMHLVGYEDKDSASAAEMRLAEKDYLARLGIEHRGFADDGSGSQSPRSEG